MTIDDDAQELINLTDPCGALDHLDHRRIVEAIGKGIARAHQQRFYA